MRWLAYGDFPDADWKKLIAFTGYLSGHFASRLRAGGEQLQDLTKKAISYMYG